MMQEEPIERSGIQRITQRQQRAQLNANGENENNSIWDFEPMAKSVLTWDSYSNEENLHPNLNSGMTSNFYYTIIFSK